MEGNHTLSGIDRISDLDSGRKLRVLNSSVTVCVRVCMCFMNGSHNVPRRDGVCKGLAGSVVCSVYIRHFSFNGLYIS